MMHRGGDKNALPATLVMMAALSAMKGCVISCDSTSTSVLPDSFD